MDRFSNRCRAPGKYRGTPRAYFGVICLAALAAFTACGTSGAAGSTPGAATRTPGSPGAGETTIRGCPGPLGNALDVGTPGAILTLQEKQTSASVGELVQLRVPDTMRWTLGKTSIGLDIVPPEGLQDRVTNDCIWSFRTTSAGTAAIELTGEPLCEPNVACPQYLVVEDFTIVVT